ncbi:MAG: hypothetical protein IKW70_01610 [Verrucomicrobia bacterium]|nr:hypothetical protein [Verrucomicrobiota bacterium]MBR5978727.1 hypothetical protein [Verrucomicrobiota bacterium]
MKKINPLYFRYDEGWLLRTFLKKGGLFGAALGVTMPFTGFFFFNTFPLKFVLGIRGNSDNPEFRFLNFFSDIPFYFSDYISLFLFIVIVAISYCALLGAFAGFISNAMLCIYKKVKMKIDEEDVDNVDYLDFSKKITKAEVERFLKYGVILTFLAVVIPSCLLWNVDNVRDLPMFWNEMTFQLFGIKE